MEDWIHITTQIKSWLWTLLNLLSLLAVKIQPVVKKMVLVMLGGSLGAVSRYGISLLAARMWGARFPWGTLTVNLTGCFLIGLLFALSERVRILTPDMRLLLITGYLGALTTFSTFSLETVNTGRAGLTLEPIANILVNNIGGLALTVIGLRLGGFR